MIDLAKLMISSRDARNEKIENKNNEKIEKIENNEKIENTKNKKGGFKHASSIIIKEGEYKGYYGFIADFYPATYMLSESGHGYIEVEGRRLSVGEKTITLYGESIIENFIPAKFSSLSDNELLEIVVYNDNSELKLGYIWKNKTYTIQYFLNQGIDQQTVVDMVNNPNNVFIVNIDIGILTMQSLNINSVSDLTDDIIENMNNMTMNTMNNTTISPISLVKEFSKQIKNNEKFKQDLMYELTLMGGKKYLDIKNPQDKSHNYVIKSVNPDVVINKISKKDIIGKPYFIHISTGDDYIYRPDKNTYYVSYNKLLQFKPNMIEIQNDKSFAKVKSGPYAKKVFKIEKYNLAHLKVILSSNGRTIESQLIKIIDSHGNSTNITSPIYPKHVFYVDMLLKNGNLAECIKIIGTNSLGRKLEINEKIDDVTSGPTFIKKTITECELTSDSLCIPNFELLNGFRFIDYEDQDQDQVKYQVQDKDRYKNLNETNEMLHINEEIEQETHDQPDFETEEHDYGQEKQEQQEENAGEIIYDNDEAKNSFKDFERTYFKEKMLTATQNALKTKINNVSKLLQHQDINDLEILKKVENVINCVKNISKTTIKLDTDTNIKFIITCILMYDMLNYGFNFDIDASLKKLFSLKSKTTYFNIQDITNIENNVFITIDLPEEFFKNITELKKSKNYTEIIKMLLLHADKIIQKCLGINVNLFNKFSFDESKLISLGKRSREDEEILAVKKIKEGLKKYVSYKNILNNSSLPEIETPIEWSNYKYIIDAYKLSLEKKEPRKKYEYIIQNIYRIPFALKNDMIANDLKTYLLFILDSIKSAIQSEILKENFEKEKLLKKKREINEYRATSAFKTDGKYDITDSEIKDTGSYLRKKKLMESKKSIGQSSQKNYRLENILNGLSKKFNKMTPEERLVEKSKLENNLEKDKDLLDESIRLSWENPNYNTLNRWLKLIKENEQ